ncbi:sugar ABC transporter permease [Clostridia bacterium]|nr:sugar ABC transporter permease [Clostridia bacterium]
MTDSVTKQLRIESARTRARKISMDIIALVICVIFLFPLLWILITSIKPNVEVFSNQVYLWPKAPTLAPWIEQLTSSDFLRSLKNSFTIAVLNMVLATVLGVPAAYGLARYRVPFRRVILLMFLVTQMMPGSLLLTPLYLTFSKLKILNQVPTPVLAIATGSIPFIVVTMRPFFLSLPRSLDEAARIDGCNAFSAFVYIMLPVARTGLITCLVFSFLHGWNDLVYSMTFNVKDTMRPLTANIYKFLDKYGTRWNSIMAYGMILVIPVLLLFVFLQRYIIGGLTSGAIKE